MFGKDNEDQLNPELMTKEIIKPMKYSGCRPGYRTWWEKILGLCFLTYCIIILLLSGIHFAFNLNIGIQNIILEMIVLIGYLQVVAKYTIALTKGDLVMSMLNSIWNDFWSIRRLDDKHKKSAITLYALANRISKIYKVMILIGGCLHSAQTFLKMDKSLVNAIWIPHNDILKVTPYYEIVFAVQSVMIIFVVYYCIVPLDQLFIQLIFFVCVQFQIIREEIKLLNSDDYSDKKSSIKRIVDHHNILLRFSKIFENVFSELLLITIGSDYILITLSMYGITYDESINQRAVYIGFYIPVMIQIFAYCLSGQLVQDQSLIVAEAAYEIEWYSDNNKSIRKDIINIIARSHRQIRLTAGGIMDLNMESFLKIVQTTFSMLTFLFNVRKTEV